MKKILFFSFSFVFLFMVTTTSAVHALTDSNALGKLVNDTTRMENKASTSAVPKGRKLAEVIKRADTLIGNRIKSLNVILTRIQNDKRLTDAQKSSLSSTVQTSITGLTALKTKIDADTDVNTAFDDAKQIFTTYRIYEILEPKIRLTITLQNFLTMVNRMQIYVPQLQTLISNLQSQGKDVSALSPLLTDVSTQLSSITTAVNADLAILNGISPTTQNPSTLFTQVRTNIKEVIYPAFKKIRTDISGMRPLFKKLILPTGKPSDKKATPSSSLKESTSPATPKD